MLQHEVEHIETDLLLDAIFRRYGYDFRHYARASVERRVRGFLVKSGCATVADMIPRLLRDESFFAQMVQDFSITVTEMFRDPHVYASIRNSVVPLLKTYPFIKAWHAGCATGEEAYSLAIVLKEESLFDKTTIFATDFNDHALEQAKQGIYPIDKIRQVTRNYQTAGGRRSFSEYYHAGSGAVAINSLLRNNITFANHNLVTDGVFGEMHLILCRNVLIYFDRELQDRVLNLFSESLVRGGFLCLGTKETLDFSSVKDHFEAVDKPAKIYRKRDL